MDIKKRLVLEYLLSLAPTGESVVVDKDDMVTMLAENRQTATVKEVDLLVSNLNDTEFISVKYNDQSMVCLTPLAKARIAARQGKDGVDEIKKISGAFSFDVSAKRIVLFSMLGGFAGSALAVGIAELIKFLAR